MGNVVINTLTTNQKNVNAIEYNNLVVPLVNEFNGNIDNTNISASAAIAYSKLNLSGSIVNADINSSAAIAFSKLASLTDGNILVGNGSNVPASVAVSGDITIDNTGAVTIANDAVEPQMLEGIVGVPSTYHVSSSTQDTTTSGTFEDLNSMSITFTPDHASNPILILFSAYGSNNNNNGAVRVILDIGGNIATTERRTGSDGGSANQNIGLGFQHYTTLAASEQTVKVQFSIVGAGTGAIEHRALTVIEFKQN